MPDVVELVSKFHLFGHTNIKILMVVDSTIRTVEGSGQFGIGRVARLIDNLSRGCSSFSVDTARRDPYPGGAGSAENQGHISTSFRFNATDEDGKTVIDSYDQIWMFGLHGEGSGPVVSNAELRVLTDWMNKGGGVFATGDHFDLGASMCSGIPRIREMRRWTVADNVPPGGGFTRLDTNRPENNSEATGATPMFFDHERDETAQKIDWIPVASFQNGFSITERPHEVLCHPQLGPIDVMPDHPHEGRTKELAEMNLARSYNFGGGVSGNDFPGNVAPKIIARGDTYAAPPSSKPYKGNCGFYNFPMISVYDGRSQGVKGRVATDSTWHHWFDLNIYELENAATNTDWKKIARYFENLAVWLSPPGRFRTKCWFLHDWLTYPLVEEVNLRKFDLREAHPQLGPIARHQFIQIFGPCATTRIVWQHICDLLPEICEGLQRFDPRIPFEIPDLGPACLTCPPFELLEDAVFAGIMRGTVSFMQEYGSAERLEHESPESVDKMLDAHFAPAIEASVKRYAKSIVADLEADLKTWSRVAEVTSRRETSGSKSKSGSSKAKTKTKSKSGSSKAKAKTKSKRSSAKK